MVPLRPALLALALVATPAFAQSDLAPADIGKAYCAAIVAGDEAAMPSLLTPDLAALIVAGDIAWHGGDTAPTACMPVGASGTLEHPESIVFLTFPGGATSSEKLVLSFVGDNLRIDDIAHSAGGTLRESLASR